MTFFDRKKYLWTQVSTCILILCAGIADAQEVALPIPPRELLQELLVKYDLQANGGVALDNDVPEEAVITDEQALQASLLLSNLESICGKNNLTYLKDFVFSPPFEKDKLDTLSGSIGLIQWKRDVQTRYSRPGMDPGNVSGQRWCTAFLVGERTMATAGHCFDSEARKGWRKPSRWNGSSYEPIRPMEVATNMVVHFNFDDPIFSANNIETFEISNLSAYRPEGIDFALFELSEIPNGKDHFPLSRDSRVADDLAIIQHPAGDAKSIDTGTVESNIRFLRYSDLDTKGGSSGSPVLDSTGQVLGVHIRGGCTETGGANFAVPTRRFLKHIEK